MKDKLNIIIKDAIEKLSDAQSNLNSCKIDSITISKKYFNDKFMHTVNVSEHFPEFKELKTKNKPILYWFELTSAKKNNAIWQEYYNYREPLKRNFTAPNYRNTSSYKKKYETDSKTLYVGKVEKGFWGRLVTHLGYAQSVKTAGMQLHHWYDVASFGELKLNYIEFDINMKHLIIILEKQLAKDLKPLIGIY